MEIELKVGRNILKINENDVIMDNGACYQIITKQIGYGWNASIPKMSKKLFTDLLKANLIYTNGELMNLANKEYVGKVVLYKFNIEDMKNK